MAKKKIIGGIPDDSIKTVFDNIPSSTIYKLGDFRLEGNFDRREIKDYSYKISNFSKEYTLESFSLTETISDKIYRRDFRINSDYSKISSNSIYGSLRDKFEYTILSIINKFPYSLFVNNSINGSNFLTVLNYSYDSQTDQANFNVPVITVTNVGNLIVNSGNFATSEKPLNNLNLSKKDYVIYLKSTGKEYNVLNFVGDINNDQYLNFTVEGNPFPSSTSVVYHIKPKKDKYFEFINGLDNLERYFLSNKKEDRYIIKLKKPSQSVDGFIKYSDKYLEWTFFDGYNLDIQGFRYEEFIKGIIDIGKVYDDFKTDNIYRMYTTTSLKQFDETSGGKLKLLNRTYGHSFDKVRELIDSLSTVNKLSYNRNIGVSDFLVKNLANTLGWNTTTIVKEDNIIKKLFGFTQGDISESTIPSEIDIELWRRILMNTSYFFKSKGTRDSIITFFKLIGIPEQFIELNEFIYIADKNLSEIEKKPFIDNVEDFSEFELEEENQPFYDDNGYPRALKDTNDLYFQIAGNTDLGQTYINRFRKNGFKVSRINDNKKSWVYSEKEERRQSDRTGYKIKDSRLLINTKEISVGLSPSSYDDFLVYNNNPNMTFGEFLDMVTNTFIDVKNRKIISDNLGGMYPKLSEVYYSYVLANPNYSYRNLLNFIKNFDEHFLDFLNQLIPATVIYRGNGLLIKNNSFLMQKYRYIRGINDGSEFVGNTGFLTCELFKIDDVVKINPTGNNSGSFEIIASGGNGEILYSIDGGENYNASNIFNELEPDEYKIVIMDHIGCKIEQFEELILDCKINITTLDVEMDIPVIQLTLPSPTPTAPPKITPTPPVRPVLLACPLGLAPELFAGPYRTSTEACLLAPTAFSEIDNIKQITLYINKEAVNMEGDFLRTAWLNCEEGIPSPALNGYYSNGGFWFYVSNVVSANGSNVSGSGTCAILSRPNDPNNPNDNPRGDTGNFM